MKSPDQPSTPQSKNLDEQYRQVLQLGPANRPKPEFCSLNIILIGFLIIILCAKCKESSTPAGALQNETVTLFNNADLQELGEKLFFDKNLSYPEGQSCADCHGPDVGWTGPDEQVNKTGGVYPGAMHQRFGNRKPNSAAYATLSPVFHAFMEAGTMQFAGGNFWDGRATGFKLGNPASDQAQGPFLNPVEQNIPDAKTLIEKVSRSEYASLYRKVAGDIWKQKDILGSKDINLQFGIIGIAIAAFENSEKVNMFSSKYDYFLRGKIKLTAKEQAGLELFEGKGKCANCHIMESDRSGIPPLFTDFTFDNIGIPKNPLNPWYSMDTTINKDGSGWIDRGLAELLKEMPQYAMYEDENIGKHQVPTLRNVDKRPNPGYIKCYGHNGYFKSLEEIVHFYNTRDVLPQAEGISDPKPGINCWPQPEITKNINKTELGNLNLSAEEESAIVEFMKTLSDGYSIENNQSHK